MMLSLLPASQTDRERRSEREAKIERKKYKVRNTDRDRESKVISNSQERSIK